MTRIKLKPSLLIWARRRAGLDQLDLVRRFPRLPEWEAGTLRPTLHQLEEFARATYVPVGYMFLSEPPQEKLPISDFRTFADSQVASPSPNLLETIYLCQQRQEWYRDYARLNGLPTLNFIGSVTVQETVVQVAGKIRQTLALSISKRQQLRSWTDALRDLIEKIEHAGILVMVSGVVGNNNHRKLAVEEFRGFALADNLAPLIFLNGNDSKAAQMFTLSHELAHLWLGSSGISEPDVSQVSGLDTERWCNQVAAEFLMPMELLHGVYQPANSVTDEIQRLAAIFKISTLVALRRLFDAGYIDAAELRVIYQKELARIRSLDRQGTGGGDFYRTLSARVSKRFQRAVLTSTLEGQTMFQEAFRLLGMRKSETLYTAAGDMGILQ